MTLLRKRLNVRTNGRLRSLLLIEEKAQGDVYIRIKSGTQVGIPPNHVLVVQDRYSVHPSINSQTYTTLKKTVELANGFISTGVALTDAVKRQNGFAHLFTHRSSDLNAPVYDIDDDGRDSIILGDFDPIKNVLVFGLFVGHPETVFGTGSGQEAIDTFCSSRFQFVICSHWITLPAAPFAWTMNSITFDPNSFEDEAGQEWAHELMKGETPKSSLELFHGLSGELTVNLLETYLAMGPDEATRKWLEDLIESVPRTPSIKM